MRILTYVDASLKRTQYSSDGCSQSKLSEDALFPNHSGQEDLVDPNKLCTKMRIRPAF